MTGRVVGDELTDPTYWRKHLRNTVRFGDGVATLHEQGVAIFVEIGAGATLLGMAQSIYDLRLTIDETASSSATLVNRKSKIVNPAMLPSLRKNQSDWQQMLTSLGALYVHGVAIDWEALEQGYHRRKVTLPTYPFQRERYWAQLAGTREAVRLTPLIDKLTRLPRHRETMSETQMNVERLPFLLDHRVFGQVVSPGACQLAMTLDAAQLAYPEQTLQLVNVVLPQALVVGEDEGRTIQVVFDMDWPSPQVQNGQVLAPQRTPFELISFCSNDPDSILQTHVSGNLALADFATMPAVDVASIQSRCPTTVDVNTFYATSTAHQVDLGPTFRWLDTVWAGEQEIIGHLVPPAGIDSMVGYSLHPALLDACFQLTGMYGVADQKSDEDPQPLLPFAVDLLTVCGEIRGNEWWGYAQKLDENRWHIQLLDTVGNVLVEIVGFTARKAPHHLVLSTEAWHEWLYDVRWIPQPLSEFEMATAVEPTDESAVSGLWLCFAQPDGMAAELAAYLQQQGQSTLFCGAGHEYEWEEQIITLNPTRPDHIQRLLLEL
ncbi:MAG: polyketide synthase dehydratase domain-containing protein [Caldilineaceae bacterium]